MTLAFTLFLGALLAASILVGGRIVAALDSIKEAASAVAASADKVVAVLEQVASGAVDPAEAQAVADGLKAAASKLSAAADEFDGDPNTPPVEPPPAEEPPPSEEPPAE